MLKPPMFRCNQTVTVYRKIKGSDSHYHSVSYEKTGTVVTPELGRSFGSLGEAYNYYNMYFQEIGFGIKQ